MQLFKNNCSEEHLSVTTIAESKLSDLFWDNDKKARPSSETMEPLEHLGSWDIRNFCEICKIFENIFFYRTPPVVASQIE